MKNKRVLQQDQYDLLIPPTGSEVHSDKFDITNIMVLLTNFCGFKYPMKSWIPQETDIDVFANIVRVKRSRDQLQHNPFEVSDAKFKRIVPLFTKPLLALGTPQQAIDDILNMRIMDENVKQELREYEQDKDVVKKYLKSQTYFSHNFIPPVNNFYSRAAELDKLHANLIQGTGAMFGAVLSGLPGVGKSETARQYLSLIHI